VFSSKAAAASGLARKLGIAKKLYPVQNTRGGISKKSMIPARVKRCVAEKLQEGRRVRN
jgi:urease alpha subunit